MEFLTVELAREPFNGCKLRELNMSLLILKNILQEKQAIATWVSALTSKPMRNTSGQAYRALADNKKDWTEQQWIDAFANDAMLLKRPLFVKDKTAVLVGFAARRNGASGKVRGRVMYVSKNIF